MIKASGITGPAAIQSLGWGTKLWGIGGILGYICFGYLADWFGRRPTIVFFNIGAIASGLYLYLGLSNWDLYPYMLPVFGFFIFGVFSGHAIWLPELFPTYVRATSLSFCNGTGRIITSFGPLVAGLLAGAFGGDFNLACAVMTCFAVAEPGGCLHRSRNAGRAIAEVGDILEPNAGAAAIPQPT